MLNLSDLDQVILNTLPQSEVTLAFSYGSKVFKQNSDQKPGDLIDIIIVTDNPLQWHKENYSRNNQHYSFLRYLPNCIDKITQLQEQCGARIYFNPYVKLSNYLVKYGVIKTEHLIEDLLHWNKIYVAGRLHKPVRFILNTCDRNEALRHSLRFNKESAIRAALVQLPETFDTLQLYKTITGLSYKGDFRMIFGEDKNKIDNIATGQVDEFNQIYLPTIKLNNNFKQVLSWNDSKQVFTQDLSSKSLLKHLKLLPSNLRNTICREHGRQINTLECDAILSSVSRSINCDKIVANALSTIVRKSSISQSLKGLLTAGLLKSLKYSQSKITKSVFSRLNSA